MGYAYEDVELYCGKINNYIDTIHPDLIQIWRTGNNGQVARDINLPNNKHIGNWSIAKGANEMELNDMTDVCEATFPLRIPTTFLKIIILVT